jgi:sulfur-carrier protein adenylyltransferase/sulfurtransferase
VRSKAAAQLLLKADFENIYNMKGGIIAYKGGKAVGDEAFGMDLFVGGEFSDVFRMSYAMEEGLQQLYLLLEEMCDEPEVKILLGRLAKFEEGHKAKLKALFPGVLDGQLVNSDSLEGGFDKQQVLSHFHGRKITGDEVIQLGMMLETQAYDLYSRLAEKADNSGNKEFFLFMVGEEKLHLKFLSDEYDKVLSN